MTRVVVLDYGSGNLRSAVRALERTGAAVILTDDVELAAEADGLVVPGVGAFAACMGGLRDVGGVELIDKRLADDRPTLGICVGHQVLFDRGVEHGVQTAGCGVLPGTVERLAARRLPHMGWNTVAPPSDSTLFVGVREDRFYFVHSYAARALDLTPEARITWAEHEGDRFVAAVEWGTLSSTQFHPEKSGDAGARLLTNWVATL
ncbi:MAG: imidazole glycerol phosphate synthase subunit HisH [Propionibacteriaceae bacterium]